MHTRRHLAPPDSQRSTIPHSTVSLGVSSNQSPSPLRPSSPSALITINPAPSRSSPNTANPPSPVFRGSAVSSVMDLVRDHVGSSSSGALQPLVTPLIIHPAIASISSSSSSLSISAVMPAVSVVGPAVGNLAQSATAPLPASSPVPHSQLHDNYAADLIAGSVSDSVPNDFVARPSSATHAIPNASNYAQDPDQSQTSATSLMNDVMISSNSGVNSSAVYVASSQAVVTTSSIVVQSTQPATLVPTSIVRQSPQPTGDAHPSPASSSLLAPASAPAPAPAPASSGSARVSKRPRCYSPSVQDEIDAERKASIRSDSQKALSVTSRNMNGSSNKRKGGRKMSNRRKPRRRKPP